MKDSSIYDCSIVSLDKINDRSGNITVVEGLKNVPFNIRRVYYLYDIPGGESRGGHAHKDLYQLIVAVSGSFEIVLNDGINSRTVKLDRPNYGLLMVPGIWRELNGFSSGAVCMVLASMKYDEADYIRSFSDFKSLKNDS